MLGLICFFRGHVWRDMYGMRYDGEPLGSVIGKRCRRCWTERYSETVLPQQ